MSKKNDLLTYEDYVQGIDKLKPEQQLSLVELLTAKIKKQLQTTSSKHKISELDGSMVWEQKCGTKLKPNNTFKRKETLGTERATPV